MADIWNTPLRRAWQWIVSGVERGLTATAALREYREAGQRIANQTWYDNYRTAFEQLGQRESIREIPRTYTIPESMFTESGFDWREKYVMQMEVQGTIPETGQRYSKWVTVESDELLTKAEWQHYAQEAIYGTPGSIQLEVDGISDFVGYIRVGQ